MAKILDGKALAEKINGETKKMLDSLKCSPKLAIIDTNRNPQTELYVRNKKKTADGLGISMDLFEPKSEEETISLIRKLNSDGSFTAMIIQMPLRKEFDTQRILSEIAPEKDVDCLGPYSLGKVLLGDETIAPPTAAGILTLLAENGIDMVGKNVTIINNSSIIGKPLALMLSNRFATVSICHVKTENVMKFTERADIIITATGIPKLLTGDMIKIGAVVVDAGVSIVDGRITGDADYPSVSRKASYITPVLGGVGPVTVAMLMKNIACLAGGCRSGAFIYGQKKG